MSYSTLSIRSNPFELLRSQKNAISEVIDVLKEMKGLQKMSDASLYIKDNLKKCSFQIPKLVKVRSNLEKCINRIRHIEAVEDHPSQQKDMPSSLASGINIKMIKVQASQLPRYEYAMNNLMDVVMRYKALKTNGIDQEAKRCISFYYCTGNCSDNVVDVFLQHAAESGKIISKRSIGPFNECLHSIDESKLSCFVVPVHMEDVLAKICSRTSMVFIIADTEREARAVKYRHNAHPKKNTFVLHIGKAWKQIDTLLENWIFLNLKPVCEAISRDIGSQLVDQYEYWYEEKPKTGKRKAMFPPSRKERYRKRKVVKSDEHKTVRRSRRLPNGNSGCVSVPTSTFDDEMTYVSKVIYLEKDYLSMMKQESKVALLEEIFGLFNMSEVSIEDMPNIPWLSRDTDLEMISRVLFSKVEGIHGIGFRMDKLQITLKDGQKSDTVENKSQIRQILHDLNVYEYEIIPMSMCKYLQPGDEIDVGDKRGSFGCFAKMEETKGNKMIICGLLSKHVASSNRQNTELSVIEDGKLKRVGSIINKTATDGGLDIAAAALYLKEDECDTRFRSSSGEPVSGKIDKIPPARLRGQKVHMWGAKSKPGRGIITVPEYKCNGMDHTLIQVEDIADGEGTVDKRFAQPGDSGAIACIEVPGKEYVKPLSMQMGSINFTGVEKDDTQKEQKVKGQYLTVPLSNGLEQISKRIGRKVEFC